MTTLEQFEWIKNANSQGFTPRVFIDYNGEKFQVSCWQEQHRLGGIQTITFKELEALGNGFMDLIKEWEYMGTMLESRFSKACGLS